MYIAIIVACPVCVMDDTGQTAINCEIPVQGMYVYTEITISV